MGNFLTILYKIFKSLSHSHICSYGGWSSCWSFPSRFLQQPFPCQHVGIDCTRSLHIFSGSSLSIWMIVEPFHVQVQLQRFVWASTATHLLRKWTTLSSLL